MGQISLQAPVVGEDFSISAPKVDGNFTTIQNVINGNIEATNMSAATAQAAAVNQSGQTVKGSSVIATSESRTNVAYGALATPDQVTGIVLPANGLIAVWYQATWQESVSNAARAAIFVGANQAQSVATASATSPTVQEAQTVAGTANTATALATFGGGLKSNANSSNYTGDSTTGQVVGVGTPSTLAGGPCYIFAAAGTYTISVQFKASSGSVTAANRKLWVQALSFA